MPSPPMFTHYSSSFGDNAPQFGHLLLQTAMAKFTIMSFVLFIQAADYSVADFFMPAHLQAIIENGSPGASKKVRVPH